MTSAGKTGITTLATPTDTDVVITRIVHAPRHLVFDAWTNPKHIPQWLLGPPGWSMPVCEVDLRVGGRWTFGWRKGDGAEMTMTGLYREVTPPERVVTTEAWGPEWPETVNTVTFTESHGFTTIALNVHYPTKAARDAALKTGMKDGMDHGFIRLETLLETLR